jgi:hypothetical protein
MENERKIAPRERATPEQPILKFRIGKKIYDLGEILSSEERTRRNALVSPGAGVLTPGDEVAHDLIRGLEQIDEYRRAMPRLLEYAQRAAPPGENFSAAFIGNICRIFDETAEKMGLTYFKPRAGEKLRPVTFCWPIDTLAKSRERETFFARAYGYIEWFREEIWNSPHDSDLGRYNQTRRERKTELRDTGLGHPWVAPFRQSDE